MLKLGPIFYYSDIEQGYNGTWTRQYHVIISIGPYHIGYTFRLSRTREVDWK